MNQGTYRCSVQSNGVAIKLLPACFPEMKGLENPTYMQ